MAGRNVGRIEVTVDAETGTLAAQLHKDGKRDGRAYKKSSSRSDD